MQDDDLTNAIAIVGMSGKFPGADGVEAFWENLCAGKDTISLFSDEELLAAAVSKVQIDSSNYVKARGILDGIEMFDSDFFGLNAKEAQLTDPQHRLFLECAWEALENAGYCPDNYRGSIGVYGGTSPSSYYLNNIHPNQQLRENFGDFLLRIGNDKDYLTTRVSYKLNIKGPSITIQTACSTSLVAICMACNHLLTYQCDMALAGGVAISVPQTCGYNYQEGMIYSKDGRCRPFDAQAEGTVMSNGVGIVVLKRLQDAVADKDHIFSVIRGYGINNDGSGKLGYVAPSVQGQAEAISLAISMADVDPETITYVEAHGTGTILGDPVEIQGLAQAFNTTKKQYCAIGSVKSNIGHTFEAAGVIGLIKATLALYHQKIPPSLHFQKPNPHIDFADTPFYINTSLKDWQESSHPRRAGVSSFGIGGTNAHVILEEWQQKTSFNELMASYPLLLSAKTLTALKTMVINLGQYLQKHPEFSLTDIAYTLQVGRKIFEHTRVLVCRNREEAISLLTNFDPNGHIATPDLYKDEMHHRVPLPSYPFEKKRCWVDPLTTYQETAAVNVQCQSIEHMVKETWTELLGIESIGIHDDFFQIGGDSLLAIEVATRLSKQFGISLGTQILLAQPTIAQLSKVIAAQQSNTSPLIKLKTGNADNPLFLIHPIEGILFCYRDLVAESTFPNPIYGMQSVDKENKSIEELAAFYIQELRKVQPRGPYYLLGASFGGIIAYEMARQLEATGESIALLSMVDTATPNPAFASLPNDEARLSYLIEFLTGKPISGEKPTIAEVMQSLGIGTMALQDQQTLFNRITIHLRLLANYQPKPYGGKILFFQATDDLHTGWTKLVNGQIEKQKISGDHISILKEPGVRIIAHAIDRHLQNLQRLHK